VSGNWRITFDLEDEAIWNLDLEVALSPEMALRIEKAFDVSMDTMLRMQAWYDAYTMRQRSSEISVQRYEPPEG
jgi:plasmid maintenance system antidote protein VapI